MQNRRDFLKTAALAAFSSGLVARQALAGESLLSTIHINKLGLGGKMKMTFFPYELKLRHVFTVATYSRITTPDVQVEIEYEGVTGWRSLYASLFGRNSRVCDEFPWESESGTV